jgi:hypothetical protein
MNRILSLANRPRLERHENPKRARVKKKNPGVTSTSDSGEVLVLELTQPILESSDIVSRI